MMEVCPDCNGWREDKTWYKDGKKVKYWKCMTCGGIEDGRGNKYRRDSEEEHTEAEPQREDLHE